jgi:hypothetical protein
MEVLAEVRKRIKPVSESENYFDCIISGQMKVVEQNIVGAKFELKTVARATELLARWRYTVDVKPQSYYQATMANDDYSEFFKYIRRK